MTAQTQSVSPKTKAKPSEILEILAVASEMYPFIKTGGLADVVGALPAALADLPAKEAAHVTTLLPGYPAVLAGLTTSAKPKKVLDLPQFFGGDAVILRTRAHNLDLFILDAPHLYQREGNPYLDNTGTDWVDNPERFAALSLAGAMLGQGAVADYQPALIHAHDWQAALTPAYLHYLPAAHTPKTILTIHNLAFQGQYTADVFARLGLPAHAFSLEGVEYYSGVGFLKAGIQFANAITTVSPTYATDICTAQGGMGLDGLLRARGDALVGIVNGIDMALWNPADDPHIAQTFDTKTIELRAANKRAIEAHFKLPHSDAPLICLISRLTWQKGIDLLIDCIDPIVYQNIRLVVLGTGDPAFEAALYAAARKHPTHVGIQVAYSEPLSHQMQAGSDAILVPSRFEPCGLTQLYGLRYGCVPIVARVGGLADTIIDANDAAINANAATGIQFHETTTNGFTTAIRRAVKLYRQPKLWRKIQTAGMKSDIAWRRSALQYAQLYRQLLAQ